MSVGKKAASLGLTCICAPPRMGDAGRTGALDLLNIHLARGMAGCGRRKTELLLAGVTDGVGVALEVLLPEFSRERLAPRVEPPQLAGLAFREGVVRDERQRDGRAE